MSYYDRPPSPRLSRDDPAYARDRDRDWDRDRDREPYHPHDRSFRPPPLESRDRDTDYYAHSHHRSYRSSYSRSRSRSPRRQYSPPRNAPKGSRAQHRSRSGSMDRGYRDGGRGGGSAGSGGGGGYYDRDAPPSNGSWDRERSRSRERDWYGGPPSRDVIVEGLGEEMKEDDILRELKDVLKIEGVEKVTIIRDRKTGISRQFGFIHFRSTLESKAFLERYYPTVSLGPLADRCRIAFSREREHEGEKRGRRRDEGEEEWRCRLCLTMNYPRRHECFRCAAPKAEITSTGNLTHPTPTHFTNDGAQDEENSTPSQFLIFRSLESSVNEELLSKGVLKLTTSNTALPPSTSKSGPIGAKVSSIKRVLLVRDRRTEESWRYGFVEFATVQDAQAALTAYQKLEKFTISSKPVTVSYIHPGVFVPVYGAPKAAEKWTFAPLSPVGAGIRLAYWDEEGYVSELFVSKQEEKEPPAETKPDETENAQKEKDKKSSKKRKADKESGGTLKKAVPSHLQFWQNRHSELRGIPPPTNQEPEAETENGDGARTEKKEKAKPEEKFVSFADMNKLACLLCSRVFKTPEKIHEHERVSTLHQTNLKDPKLREAALIKLAKAGITPTPVSDPNQPEYRDRAKERRQVFGQSSNPQASKPHKPKPKVEELELPKKSIGAALLGKMGWSEGEGLGASGEGRRDHVVAEVFEQGVGLGMKGAKIGDVEGVAKRDEGYGDFVRRTREKAKERYEGME
ncbi:hypothetical protein RUND412_002953 [Rhizina undulata]